jgi:integrase
MEGPMSPNKQNEAEAYFLPAVAKTFAGGAFHPKDDVWKVWSASRILYFDFSNITGADERLIPPIKTVFSWYVQHRSSLYAHNMLSYTRHFFGVMLVQTEKSVTSINNQHLMSYRNSLGAEREHYLSSLAGLLKKWRAFGHPGVDASAIDYLRKVRLSGCQKGAAVLTMDPVGGPFTDLEFEAIHASVNEAFRKADLSLADYMATRLFMMLGSRPIQIALLKIRDLSVANNPDGAKTYSLKVPRAKQQGVVPRSEFKWRPLIPDLGALLAEYCRRIRLRFDAIVEKPDDAPMFPLDAPDPKAPQGLEWHLGSTALSARVIKAFGAIAPVSERTGEPIHMTPTRFRRTLATRAAIEGHGALVIAEMLDHTNTQNVQVYIEARPDIVMRIGKAIAMQMAPLAQAFAGAVVLGDDKTRPRITDPRFDAMHSVGSCGQHSHCAFSAPIACYTCSQFNAWVDGPHEVILEHLIAEEERLSGIVDDRIVQINRRTILAVAQVVKLCDERRQTVGVHG